MATTDKLTALGRVVAEVGDDAVLARERPPLAERLVALREAREAQGRREGARGGESLRWPVAMGAALGAAAAALILWRPAGPLTFAVGEPTTAGEIGAWVVAPPAQTVPIGFSDGTRVRLDGGARVRVLTVDAHGARVAIERGAVRADVVPRAGNDWSVSGGPFEIHVTGTSFDASWDPEREVLRVSMREGRVVVRAPCLAPERALVAGESVSLSCAPPRDPGGGSAPTAAVPTGIAPAPARPSWGGAPAPSTGPADTAPGVDPEASATAPPPSWRDLAHKGEYKAALAAAEAQGWGGLCESLSAADLLELGTTARLGGERRARGGGLHRRAAALRGERSRGGGGVPPGPDGVRRVARLRRGAPLVLDLPRRAPRRRAGGRGARPRHGGRAAHGGSLPRAGDGAALPRALSGGRARRAREEPARAMTVRARTTTATAAAIAVAALVALWPARAGAEGQRVLFVASASTPFSARVRAEIEAMGFEIEPAAELAEGDSTAAVAAARVVEGPGRRVELWIMDPKAGHLALRTVVMPAAEEDDTSETVRASEQLRAFFQPLRAPSLPLAAPAPPPPPAPPAWAAPPAWSTPAPVAAPPPVIAPEPSPELPPAPVPSPRRRFVVAADLAVPFQPGGPGLSLGLRGRWMATGLIGVGAFASVPLLGSTVTAAQGSATVSGALLGADLTLVAEPAPWMRLSTSAGLGAGWVRTSGFASAPYQGQPSNIVVAVPVIGAAVAPRVAERVHLYVDGRVGVSLPRADVAFAGHVVATWGRPLGLLSAGVSVDL